MEIVVLLIYVPTAVINIGKIWSCGMKKLESMNGDAIHQEQKME